MLKVRDLWSKSQVACRQNRRPAGKDCIDLCALKTRHSRELRVNLASLKGKGIQRTGCLRWLSKVSFVVHIRTDKNSVFSGLLFYSALLRTVSVKIIESLPERCAGAAAGGAKMVISDYLQNLSVASFLHQDFVHSSDQLKSGVQWELRNVLHAKNM